MTVWDALVGQDRALRAMRAAVADAAAVVRGEPGPAMTHAWLVTGPPGSGRSNAALAFAAALQCDQGGCGECHECRTALLGSHADVSVFRPTGTHTYLIDSMREMVLEAARLPTEGRWRVLIVEEADRFGLHGSDYRSAGALLKALEEPTPRTVWVLSAPTSADTPQTITSRCRQVALVTPSSRAVADLLVRVDGVDPSMAAFAAAASQGHVGRARGLARDEATRLRRSEVLALPVHVGTVGGCLVAAANLVDAAKEEAEATNGEREQRELIALEQEYGLLPGGRKPAGAASAMRDLEERQKRRRTRSLRDSLDRAFLDLVAFYRDVLTIQAGATVDLVNPDRRRDLLALAEQSTSESILRRIDAVLAARLAIEQNVAPLLAVEAMTLSLHAA